MESKLGKVLWGWLLSIGIIVCAGTAQAATINVPVDQPTIQAGINAAVNGDTVLVGDGTYVERINFNGKAITVKSVNGAASTKIDGNAGGSVVTFANSELHSSVLDGFTITNGSGKDVLGYGYTYGGGIFCDNNSSPTIINCPISGNFVTGIWSEGGGIYTLGRSSSTKIINCIITGNSSYYAGGGIFCRSGIVPTYENPTIINCIVSGNTAQHGGGVCYFGSSPTMVNCTISSNSATYGGGIYMDNYSPALIVNTILWGNNFKKISLRFPSTPVTIAYSDFDPAKIDGSWTDGGGNINADPLFVGGGNYHLTSGSPCIDTGTTVAVADDIDGDARPQEAGYDMGADEYVYAEPAITRAWFSPTNAHPGDTITFTAEVSGQSGAVKVYYGTGMFITNLTLVGNVYTGSYSLPPGISNGEYGQINIRAYDDTGAETDRCPNLTVR